MKMIFASLCVVLTLSLHAQTTIKGTIKNVTPGTRLTVNVPFDGRPFDDKSVKAIITPNGNFTVSVAVQHAQFALLNYGAIHLKIYVEPNAAIQLSFDAADCKKTHAINRNQDSHNT